MLRHSEYGLCFATEKQAPVVSSYTMGGARQRGKQLAITREARFVTRKKKKESFQQGGASDKPGF